MKYVVIAMIATLAVVHQDFWWWDDRTPVFGFLPIGLAWHAGISLAAGIVGWIAVTWCWPEELDKIEEAVTREGDLSPGQETETDVFSLKED